MHGWLKGTIAGRREWAEGLWSVEIDAAIEPFDPGQWVNVGLELGGEIVKRSYSIASPPGAPLELFLVRVDEGALTPALYALVEGDEVLVQGKPQGFFTLRHVPDADALWMLSTGTGLGPFLSILRHDEVWSRFERVILVNGVRRLAHLGYEEEILALAARYGDRFRYQPMVTRDADAATPRGTSVLPGRIPVAIASGALEAAVGAQLSPAAHVMLCGNPGMIEGASEVLGARGMRRHRVRKPGHLTFEKYW